MLAAGALVASLLAVGASPAGAEIDEADNTTKLSACVGDALGDQMFTDVSDDHAFGDAIDCVAYYGITNGTGDGSTYSPNDDVSRAEMAVFIARSAVVAGVDLGDAMGDEFDDLDGIWQEAQDAINQLASKGIIDGGGEFRPGDDITRAEMASFLIGLLDAASPNVTIDSDGAIQLGEGTTKNSADDHFGDVRATKPVAVDKETAALYELGVTKGASAAAGAEDGEAPIDYNYDPDGTVNRGAMAAFITRALAHTSVRPAGISAQFDGTDVRISARDDGFQPMSNVVVDAFRTDAGGVDLAFRADGSCAEVSPFPGVGSFVCEIEDGTDLITDGDGETRVTLDGGVEMGGTVVWAWTGDDEDTVGDETDLYRLDIAESEQESRADRVRVSTEHSAAKVHLGSSVIFTVQLEDADGPVNVGVDGEKPAQFLVTYSVTAIIADPTDTDPTDGITRTISPQGEATRATLPVTTDSEGKATFSVSALPDQATADKADKYRVDVWIQPRPDGNAPPTLGPAGAALTGAEATYYLGDADEGTAAGATGIVTVRSGAGDNDYTDDPNDLIFSTEASSRAAGTVSVKSANDFVAASARGASNRVTVTVADQYGDPIAGAKVTLSSSITDLVIGGGRAFAVGRDGTFTFGYEREDATSAAETLTASWNHDDDDGTTPAITGTDTVEWAAAAGDTGSGSDLMQVDTESNTIFTGGTGAVVVLRYDSNDRFNIDADGSGGDPAAASTYAAFERSISVADTLNWTIVGSGSRAVNTFTLVKAQ